MQATREVTIDAGLDEVWRFLSDPDELAGWVGPELGGATVERTAAGVTWTWAPDGVESTVELAVVESEAGTTVRVTERRASAGARACSIGDAWDERLFGLEVRCLAGRLALTRG